MMPPSLPYTIQYSVNRSIKDCANSDIASCNHGEREAECQTATTMSQVKNWQTNEHNILCTAADSLAGIQVLLAGH